MSGFSNRWKIEGSLTTVTPLHIGNGQSITRSNCEYLLAEDPSENGNKAKHTVEIAAVATDVKGKAYIPGTALKGNLRAWSGEQGGEAWKEVFGLQELGGKAEFWDAHWTSGPGDGFAPGRCWSPERLTAVAASVSIDRRTRTASDRKLFHVEFVPPGIEFQVNVTGQNLERQSVELLLQALDGFNRSAQPLLLGGHTKDGWGRLKWELQSARELDTSSVLEWLKAAGSATGHGIFDKFSKDHSTDFTRVPAAVPETFLHIHLKLEFDGLFLVNDPSQRKTGQDPLAHAPVLDQAGRPFLPASSFRGALRSQAERILRTVGGPSAAWRPGEPGLLPKGETVENKLQLPHLCLASRIFGAPGWRTPIALTDFTLTGSTEPEYLTHEMLAIDRFTGGSPTGLKFNARALCRPSLEGTLTLNLKALEMSGAGTGGLLLLAMTMRDLIEGDISLGFGAGKGYGSCLAKVAVRWPGWESIPELFREGLQNGDLAGLMEGGAVTPALKSRLAHWFGNLKRSAERSA